MINDIIANDATESVTGVWTLDTGKQISYSDGATNEHYLENVLRTCRDPGSDSHELNSRIRDWASEYHLSSLRANLLKSLDFRANSEVLEVGCGCGAITRFLGETFDTVLGIEGSLNRANLARLRTRDQQNVSILCGPFHEIRFRKKFDIIFCIGVFEYSNVFVEADDPHEYIIEQFKGILKSDGVLVLAIENQFGLKYFASSAEDHTRIMFDGIEGYPRHRNKAKTFGYDELKSRLGRHFSRVDFLFPYPDYKLPQCVVSEKMLDLAPTGELVGSFPSRDYTANRKRLFDERLALLELQKNNKLPFFSNSFLVTAGNGDSTTVRQSCLGAVYSKGRTRQFQTVTRFIEDDNGAVRVIKKPAFQATTVTAGKLTLHQCDSGWVNGLSLQLQLLIQTKEHDLNAGRLFSACTLWLDYLKSFSTKKNNATMLPGRFIDYTWKNCFTHNQECNFIDQEWEWSEAININVLIIRSIYIFLDEVCKMQDINPFFRGASTKKIIRKIAQHLGAELTNNDFHEFCNIEAKLQNLVYGRSAALNLFECKLILWNRSIHTWVGRIKRSLAIPPAKFRQLVEKVLRIRQRYANRSI